jgi:hypothetical protein
LGKCREHGASERDQPDFIAVPDRANGVDHQPALCFVSNCRIQNPDAQIESIQDGISCEQDAQENKPQMI